MGAPDRIKVDRKTDVIRNQQQLDHSAVLQEIRRITYGERVGILKGREVLVLGRGASSTDIAALLLEQGASVQIVSREPVIFQLPPSLL